MFSLNFILHHHCYQPILLQQIWWFLTNLIFVVLGAGIKSRISFHTPSGITCAHAPKCPSYTDAESTPDGKEKHLKVCDPLNP